MKRVALFLGCFLVSTGIVVWLVGGIRSPLKPEEDRVPAQRPEESTAGKLHPLMPSEARGVYIGTVSGGELNRFEEIIHDDGTVEHIPRVAFRYDSAEPSSSKLGVVKGLSGTFYDGEGNANAYVTSDRGSVRLDEKTDEVSLILLEGNVRFEERSGEKELGLLASPTLAIRFAPSDASAPDDADAKRTPTPTRPVLSTDDRVTIRKDGMLLSGDGFHGDVELRDFRIDSDVVLVVEAGAGLAMPDMLGSGGKADEDGGGTSMRIESGGALVLRGAAPEDETKEGAKAGSWGVSEATVQFVDRTTLVQGEQTFEAGALEIGLRAAAPPKPDAAATTTETDATPQGNLQAQRLFGSNGVVFRDGDLELEARTLEWTATDEPLTLSGAPRIVMRQAGGSPLFGEASGESSSGLITVMCSDRIELSTDPEAASREVQCFGDVRIFEGREFDADQPGLSADHMTLAIDESSEAATLDELIATGSVVIRDPEFVLTGGRFELVRSKNDAEEFDLVMSRGAQLRLSGAPIEGFRMDLLPGAGSDNEAAAKDDTQTEIVARAADRIVVSRETEATTLVDFLGGFTMERRTGDELIGELTSESMLLSLQKDAEGKSRLSSWNAGGDVHYESPEGTADGDHLSYSKNEGRVRLLGTRGAHRAILRFTDADGGEPQKLLAETFVYVVESDAFEAQGRVEGEFTTDAIAWQSLTERGSDENEDSASRAGADSTNETEEPEPPQRWRLQCDEADIALAREAEDNDENENEASPENPESDEEPRTTTRIAYFDARGGVRLDGESQRVRADQVTYSAVKNNVIVRGTDAEPAMLSTRDESVASTDDDPERTEEWSSVESSWFDIDTDREIVRCEDGGVLTFHVEDLLARDRDAKPERLVTTIACAGLMEFRRDRDASFHEDVRVMQIGAGDTAQRPRTKLTCGYMHVVLEPEPEDPEDVAPPANESVAGLSVRKLTCEDDVVVRHKNPNIIASGEYLELLARETMIYVHGGDDNVFFRQDDGTLEPKSLRYNYSAGKVEIWQFNFVPSRRANEERN